MDIDPNKTPKEYKFLHESQEFLKELVISWKREHDARWDKHDARSERIWKEIQYKLNEIEMEVARKPCETHHERVDNIDKTVSSIIKFLWVFVVSLLGALGGIILKIVMNHINGV